MILTGHGLAALEAVLDELLEVRLALLRIHAGLLTLLAHTLRLGVTLVFAHGLAVAATLIVRPAALATLGLAILEAALEGALVGITTPRVVSSLLEAAPLGLVGFAVAEILTARGLATLEAVLDDPAEGLLALLGWDASGEALLTHLLGVLVTHALALHHGITLALTCGARPAARATLGVAALEAVVHEVALLLVALLGIDPGAHAGLVQALSASDAGVLAGGATLTGAVGGGPAALTALRSAALHAPLEGLRLDVAALGITAASLEAGALGLGGGFAALILAARRLRAVAAAVVLLALFGAEAAVDAEPDLLTAGLDAGGERHGIV